MWPGEMFGQSHDDDVHTLLNVFCVGMAEKKSGKYYRILKWYYDWLCISQFEYFTGIHFSYSYHVYKEQEFLRYKVYLIVTKLILILRNVGAYSVTRECVCGWVGVQKLTSWLSVIISYWILKKLGANYHFDEKTYQSTISPGEGQGHCGP